MWIYLNETFISWADGWQVVKPKLEALRIAEVKLEDALKELEAAESKLQECQVRTSKSVFRGNGKDR